MNKKSIVNFLNKMGYEEYEYDYENDTIIYHAEDEDLIYDENYDKEELIALILDVINRNFRGE